MATQQETAGQKRFRLSDYVKDGHLAAALRKEMAGLTPEKLLLVQEAIIETSSTGIPGTFEQILDAHRLAIRRALEPDRKLLKDPKIDRKLIRNPQLAALLDAELVDVTAEELATVHSRLKKIFDEARELAIDGDKGGVRFVEHEQTDICRQFGRHPTIPVEDKQPCGYFRGPDEWREVLRLEVRKALNR